MTALLMEEKTVDLDLQSISQDLGLGYRTLVIASDDLSIAKIVRTLHGISRSISIFRSIPAAMVHLRSRPVQVLIFVPEDLRTWTTAVVPIDEALSQVLVRPHKFCLMHGPYQGPADRLVGSRIGWRVLYG